MHVSYVWGALESRIIRLLGIVNSGALPNRVCHILGWIGRLFLTGSLAGDYINGILQVPSGRIATVFNYRTERPPDNDIIVFYRLNVDLRGANESSLLGAHLAQLVAERMPLLDGDDDAVNRRRCNDASRDCHPIYIAGIPTTYFGYSVSIFGFLLMALGLGAVASLMEKA